MPEPWSPTTILCVFEVFFGGGDIRAVGRSMVVLNIMVCVFEMLLGGQCNNRIMHDRSP